MKWSTWLAPHLRDFQGHTECYAWLFRKLSDGSVGWKKKTYAQSPCWMGSSNAPDEWINLFITMPSGYPGIIPASPVLHKNIADSANFKDWVSTEAHSWLQLFVSRCTLHPEIIIPENWFDFARFQLQSTPEIIEEFQSLLGNGPEAFVMHERSSIAHIPTGELQLQQSNFSKGQVIAVLADEQSLDAFWLASIKKVFSDKSPTEYKLKFLALEEKERGHRGKYREENQHGHIKHTDILCGPITLKANHTIPLGTLRHILNAVQKELDLTQDKIDYLYARHA
jgi:hypothetical protein